MHLKTGIITFLWVCASACSTGPYRPCTDAGQAARDKPFLGGKRCKQKKDKKGQYVNDGKYIEWYLSGQLALEGEYTEGKKTGKWVEWDERGNKVAERYYVHGVEVPPKEE